MQIEKFSKKQGEILKFAYSNDGVLICDGAVRSGKTIVMSFAFVFIKNFFIFRIKLLLLYITKQTEKKNTKGGKPE